MSTTRRVLTVSVFRYSKAWPLRQGFNAGTEEMMACFRTGPLVIAAEVVEWTP